MLEPRQLLAQLDLAESEIDVYLAMLGGALAARDIVATTGRSRPTVYYALKTLEHRGLLCKSGLDEDRRYRVEPLERLSAIVEAKQSQLSTVKTDVDLFIEQFGVESKADHAPQVSFYEGVGAVKSVIMEVVYCHGRQIDSLVPDTNFFWQLGPEFVGQFVAKRFELGVKTRNLWAKPIEQKIIEQYYSRSQIRLMPPGLGNQFKSTVFMYDDKVLYVSSLASGYAILVQSAEHRELMAALYGSVWAASTPHKIG